MKKLFLLILLASPASAQFRYSNGSSGSGGSGTDATKLPLTGGTMSGAINMGSNLINSVTDPVSAQDAATKNYVDTSSATKVLPTKLPARLATTTALPANVYANGSSGVGATLTGAGLGTFSVDGVTPSAGDRILVNNEATAANNGIYVVNVNAGGSFYLLTRAADFDSVSEMGAGEAIIVSSGAVNIDTFWVLIASVTTVGTSPINFSQANSSFSGGKVPGVVTFVSSVTFNADAQIGISSLTFNASMSINFQTNPRPILVLTGNVTSITLALPSNPNSANGNIYSFVFCQDGTGSRTGPATWTNAIWPNYGVAPTLTTTALHCDMFFARYLAYDGNYHMMPSLNN